MDRLFLDANILFSAAYRSDGGLRRLWEIPGIQLITSTYAEEEARRNLETSVQHAALSELLRHVKVLIFRPGSSLLPSGLELPDNDRPILEGAIFSQATHLLTGDMKAFGVYYGRTLAGVLILPPATYLRGHR
ncbi:DNA-binding protein [Candidatus Methylomirabilis sp.]|uniref:DNA-binding protein n=1 Tax=Candidatus Methylomirabilis sp. TaxID=2032687 RepID=UPI003076333A